MDIIKEDYSRIRKVLERCGISKISKYGKTNYIIEPICLAGMGDVQQRVFHEYFKNKATTDKELLKIFNLMNDYKLDWIKFDEDREIVIHSINSSPKKFESIKRSNDKSIQNIKQDDSDCGLMQKEITKLKNKMDDLRDENNRLVQEKLHKIRLCEMKVAEGILK